MSVQQLPDRLLSVSEVAEIVGVTPQSVGGWIRSGDLAAVRLGSGPAARLRAEPSLQPSLDPERLRELERGLWAKAMTSDAG
jgi:excisionase family DNA binding protein